ncbi:hypothetical protein ACQKIE_04725 [Luteibacter sp. NPDC031894]|uniref:hypothetical protein n=1 Tax=Luteibacter sp. NPDC031894 TaxID=3390572 RepID=UPI003CFE2522
MAGYNYLGFLTKQDAAAYDTAWSPGSAAPVAGIYCCTACGHEIGIAQGHTLPPQGHPQHPVSLGPIRWQLAPFAMHNQ